MEMGSERSGNSSLCEALYEERSAGLVLYGRALGLSHAESEDVLQETFMSLMKLKEAPEDPANYCVRAFRNRAMNHHRGLWRRLTREFEFHRWFDSRSEETPRERAAMRCLETLPKDQREVIVLKIWQERTFDDIGRLLDLSPHTVAGRYRYGLQKLRACLREDYDEQFESSGSHLSGLGAAEAIPEG